MDWNICSPFWEEKALLLSFYLFILPLNKKIFLNWNVFFSAFLSSVRGILYSLLFFYKWNLFNSNTCLDFLDLNIFSNFCDERERELVFPPVFIRLKSFRVKYFSSFREEREREGREGSCIPSHLSTIKFFSWIKIFFSSFREEREREQGRDGRERALLFPAASDSTDIDSQQSWTWTFE